MPLLPDLRSGKSGATPAGRYSVSCEPEDEDPSIEMKHLLALLRDPLLNGMDVDGGQRLELHRVMLQRKRMLQVVFAEFHHLCKSLDR